MVPKDPGKERLSLALSNLSWNLCTAVNVRPCRDVNLHVTPVARRYRSNIYPKDSPNWIACRLAQF